MSRGAKLTPKIILEGARLTLKTEIAFALNEHPRIVGPRRYRYHSPIVSAEWCAFTNHPWGRGLINFEDAEEGRALQTYEAWIHLFELLRYYSWIVDRFHISTIAYQQLRRGRRYDFGWLERRLHALNFRLVFCWRAEESFAAAREERLRVSGNPRQYLDLSPFVEEQRLMRDLVAASQLRSFAVEVTDGNVAAAVDRIADWLEGSGGLHLRE